MEQLSNLRYKVRRVLADYPKVFLRAKGGDEKYHRLLVTEATELCIEGYPRSGNSFAFNAFRMWNPDVTVARHLHLPLQLTRAVKSNIPCIVLIRQPEESISSLSIGLPNVALDELCKSYISFYKSTLVHIENIVVSDFPTTTSFFDKVVANTNSKFDTHFSYAHISTNEEQTIFNTLTNHSENIGWKSMTSAPQPNKKNLKLPIIEQLKRSKYFNECKELYLKAQEHRIQEN